MVGRAVIRKATFCGVLVLFTTAAWAQPEVEPERWHVTGSAGFDLTGSSQTVSPSTASGGQLFPLGDLRLNTDGFVLDPKLLHINGTFGFQKGVNNSNQLSIDNGGWGLAFTTAFLPRSHFPLRVTYARTRFGIDGLDLSQDSDNSRLDIQWLVMLSKLPRISLGFQRYTNDVQVQRTFGERSFRETGANVGLSDDWRGWQWSGNFAVDKGSTTEVAGLELAAPFNDSARFGSFNLWRSFWDGKARLAFDNRETWRHDTLDASGNSDSREFTDSVRFDDQLTSKLSVIAGYSFSQERFDSVNLSNIFGTPGTTQLIGLLSSTAHAVSGGARYRVNSWLHVGQDVRYTHSTPLPGSTESRLSLTDGETIIGSDRRWHGIDLSAEYSGRFQSVGTSFGRSAGSWSNGVNARASWGNVRRARFTGSYDHTRLNLAEQIGGFTQQQRLRGEVESAWLRVFRVRLNGEQARLRILNFSGDTSTSATSFGAALEHRLFTASYSESMGSGVGALFPPLLISRDLVIVPLPIAGLVGTPLLDRDSRARSVSVFAHPVRGLEARFNWRREHNLIFSSAQAFDTLQASARYRLGKMLFEGGYSNDVIDILGLGAHSGERLRRWYFRIARDFKVF